MCVCVCIDVANIKSSAVMVVTHGSNQYGCPSLKAMQPKLLAWLHDLMPAMDYHYLLSSVDVL